jgi:colanic acid/amylovoran biosynthesis glycosyltransferase
LHWIKGIEHVLQAVSIVFKSMPNLKITIVGEGDERERLIFATYQNGILDAVDFVGKKSPKEVQQMMQSHEVFVQYSHQEGFCNAALEAQSTGMLCIVSDADGLTENVLNGQTGWVVPKRNPTALAQKLQVVLLMNEVEKDIIRQQARERVLLEFDLKKQEKAFVEFYAQ